MIRRPVNYFGSKEMMCPLIHGLIPPGVSTWVDLFCGSAVVTLKKERHPREVINDLNGDIVNLFEVLRDHDQAAELYRRVELTPYAEDLLARAYEEEPADPIAQAMRFLVVSWFGRGGTSHRSGFRWSKKQTISPEFTWVRMPERLQAVAARLRGICIRKADAFKIIDDYDDPDCVLFVDPPYPGVGYRYAVKMAADQHEALARRLRGCRAQVILTMSPGTVYSQILDDWTVTETRVVGGGNTAKPEIILTNFEPLPLLAVGGGA